MLKEARIKRKKLMMDWKVVLTRETQMELQLKKLEGEANM